MRVRALSQVQYTVYVMFCAIRGLGGAADKEPHRSGGWVCLRALGKRLLIFIALGVIGLSCGGDHSPLNVVVIGLDTLRPDHLGCYGYVRDTSPEIDELAGQGVLFENTVSQAPWTHPSFATVFTSLYPTQHAATTVGTRMSTSFPTLASILKNQGYTTGAIVNAPSLSPEFGVNRGFDAYDFLRPWHEREASLVTQLALEWMDTHGDRPFLLFVHYFDPHMPYAPPAPYDTLYDPGYSGPVGSSFNISRSGGARQERIGETGTWTAADKNHIVALYDGEITFADRAIGALLDGIDQRGLRDRTLIVFLSDHGEEFFDHQGLDHGHSLFNELIRVPMVFSLPDILPEGKRVSQFVRLLDVTPTILEILGQERQDHFEGVSLKPLFTDGGGVRTEKAKLLAPDVCYSEALRHCVTTKSLTDHPWKVIYDMQSRRKMFFNLASDPAEQINLGDDVSSLEAADEEALVDPDRLLIETLLRISDTWFVEMAGGEGGHRFSFGISTETSRAPAHFRLHKLIGDDGEIMDLAGLETARTTPSMIGVDSLWVSDPQVLAFKLDIHDAQLMFNLAIDGRPAAEQTFLGRELLRPVTMPFSERPTDAGEGLNTEPFRRPRPPYFVIWYYRSPYQGDTSIELDEELKRELRALGYIQ